jgi:hypothetical protein
VVTTITTLVLSPYSAGGAPSITSIDCTASTGKLIREYLALLIGDRLAIDGERVRSVIAEPVKQTVRIGRDSRRGHGDQGTERRGLAFQRQLVEQVAIDIRVGGGVVSIKSSPASTVTVCVSVPRARLIFNSMGTPTVC